MSEMPTNVANCQKSDFPPGRKLKFKFLPKTFSPQALWKWLRPTPPDRTLWKILISSQIFGKNDTMSKALVFDKRSQGLPLNTRIKDFPQRPCVHSLRSKAWDWERCAIKFWYCLFDAHEFVFVTLEIIFEMKLHNASELNISSIFDRKESSLQSRIAGSRLFRTVNREQSFYLSSPFWMRSWKE